ncbi:MAG: hypothetical protein ACLS36_06855 [Streptococcus sp.]
MSLAPQRYETKKRAIVLAANYTYVDQVLTTIKSIVSIIATFVFT